MIQYNLKTGFRIRNSLGRKHLRTELSHVLCQDVGERVCRWIKEMIKDQHRIKFNRDL